uniref:Lipoprotein n=1 Tax=uncultured Alphaproteobacteria bacterium TaxID=91750 RepID=A0A6G8F2V9_9PROT|nr:hypothetical protein PlAlph_4680 [uncultured Alphaproteobacteria bacterium]
MLKKLLTGALLLLTAACSTPKQTIRYCPNVVITPAYSRVTRFFGEDVQYKAEIVGFEGYCRYNEKTEQTVAVIAPIFEISRHSDIAGKTVEIPYYANTGYNAEKLLGRQPHSFRTEIAKRGEKVMVTGDEIEVRIPNDQPGYQINLEMALSRKQYQYNQKQGLKF